MAVAEQKERILPEFTMDHLGTSFKVILVNSVREIINEEGIKEILIPDQLGLSKAIALRRAIDSRKLSGGDIRFLRKSLSMKAKDLAEKLDISAEYLSRCEAGDKVMASNAEKVLRLIVLLEPFYMLEKAAEEVSADDRKFAERLLSSMSKISKVIHEMKIIPAHEIQEEFIYYFTRKKRGLKFDPANDDDGEWLAEAA